MRNMGTSKPHATVTFIELRCMGDALRFYQVAYAITFVLAVELDDLTLSSSDKAHASNPQPRPIDNVDGSVLTVFASLHLSMVLIAVSSSSTPIGASSPLG